MNKVLHVNARLSEGGAARVAKSIAIETRLFGFESNFAYGNGPHGGVSPSHLEKQDTRLSNRFAFGVNIINHRYFGRESAIFSYSALKRLRPLLAETDIIHIHVSHSYYLEFDSFILELINSGKAIIWTSHDQWLMTGRCAQPGECRNWEDGCLKCPDLDAYPPAKIDMANSIFSERKKSLNLLESNNRVIHVACASWLASEMRIAGFESTEFIPNSVDRDFWEALPNENTYSDHTRNLFVCNDLRDKGKINWNVLEAISQNENQSLSILGNNMPRFEGLHKYLGNIYDRRILAETLGQHERLIFTSKIDYFPLVLMEGLAAGLEVLAINSQAAQEFSWHPNIRIFDNFLELVKYSKETIPSFDLFQNSQQYINRFSPDNLGKSYAELYNRVLS